MIRVTCFNENVGQDNPAISAHYKHGIHMALKEFLDEDFDVKTATLEMEEHGLTDEVLNNTDVLIWWGHRAHDLVSDTVAQKVCDRVLKGMGVIFLHSSHFAKPFKILMGTSCTLKWREIGESERVWVCSPAHPIAQGVGDYFEIEHEEMYGEFFDIPTPDELVFIGWFKGGEVFRSGCCFNRSLGKVFYFQPGHETFPVYHNKAVQRVIKNAVLWANPTVRVKELNCPNPAPLEKI